LRINRNSSITDGQLNITPASQVAGGGSPE
jgi:hypothetical protein